MFGRSVWAAGGKRARDLPGDDLLSKANGKGSGHERDTEHFGRSSAGWRSTSRCRHLD